MARGPRDRRLPLERHHQQFRSRFRRLGEGLSLAAISALDIAVWDLSGRRRELPLHRLLGSHRDAVDAHGSGRATHQMSTSELIEGTESYIAEGYRAVKLRAGAREVSEGVERIRAVGEHLHRRREFLRYALDGGASVLMPDAPLGGGIIGGQRIVTLADSLGLRSDLTSYRNCTSMSPVLGRRGSTLNTSR